MTLTEAFIRNLVDLKDGERSLLRRHSGKPLHESLAGFDLFTGLWWPLREKDRRAPSRETSWLIAKLFCARPIPHKRRADKLDCASRLATLLGRVERHEYGRDKDSYKRFRARFDALLCATLDTIEPHLDWALGVVRAAHGKGQVSGLDWAQLLDDLWQWERFEKRYLSEDDREADVHDIRDEWAKHYLNQADDENPVTNVARMEEAPAAQANNP
ncbi:MAG: type I-E CRISPR-associated protein Cse2/CasB [Planctomycetes bacterium]|nr:type I-E CRISPR-associated protein Cse2/CasB [Planctomycetota bacterium]MCW8134421.1 type I-E CRISPR-associated protein Cse2/CasB [Planctomycetota bacterium]